MTEPARDQPSVTHHHYEHFPIACRGEVGRIARDFVIAGYKVRIKGRLRIAPDDRGGHPSIDVAADRIELLD